MSRTLLIRSVVDDAIYMLDVDDTVVNWNTGGSPMPTSD
jgi:hypothetical protein